MKAWEAFALCVLGAPAAGCAVHPPGLPVAAVRVAPPVVVAPAPVAVVPVVLAPVHKPHPGRGPKRGHW